LRIGQVGEGLLILYFLLYNLLLQIRGIQFDKCFPVFQILFGNEVTFVDDLQNFRALIADTHFAFNLLRFQSLQTSSLEYGDLQWAAPRGNGLLLRAPQMSDYAEWAALREASRDFLTPWEPTWPADDLTRSSFRRRIKRYSEDQRSDLAYAFFVFRKHDEVLVGGLTLANIRRGCAQAGSLGYWMGAAFARQGHMTAAVTAIT